MIQLILTDTVSKACYILIFENLKNRSKRREGEWERGKALMEEFGSSRRAVFGIYKYNSAELFHSKTVSFWTLLNSVIFIYRLRSCLTHQIEEKWRCIFIF